MPSSPSVMAAGVLLATVPDVPPVVPPVVVVGVVPVLVVVPVVLVGVVVPVPLVGVVVVGVVVPVVLVGVVVVGVVVVVVVVGVLPVLVLALRRRRSASAAASASEPPPPPPQADRTSAAITVRTADCAARVPAALRRPWRAVWGAFRRESIIALSFEQSGDRAFGHRPQRRGLSDGLSAVSSDASPHR